MWSHIYPPKGQLRFEKLNHRITKFSTLVDDLATQRFSGYIEILAPHEHGLILFYAGKIHNCLYEGTEELDLSREAILQHFSESKSQERDTIINVTELSSRIIIALSALEPRGPAHRELETTFLDMERLFQTMARKKFTGTLRFYRIRNNTRLGNLLIRLNKITPDQLREAIRLQLSGEGALRLGDALVKTHAIEPQDLQDALSRQTYTRKGSDLELAMVLFAEGEFLGGYTFAEKELVLDMAQVVQWTQSPETLMDIIDGILPPVVDASTVTQNTAAEEVNFTSSSLAERVQTESAAHQAVEPPKIFEQPKTGKDLFAIELQDLTDETFMLKADDLILDIPTSISREKKPPTVQPLTPAPEPPAAEREAPKTVKRLKGAIPKETERLHTAAPFVFKPTSPAPAAPLPAPAAPVQTPVQTPIETPIETSTIPQQQKAAEPIVPSTVERMAAEWPVVADEFPAKADSAAGDEAPAPLIRPQGIRLWEQIVDTQMGFLGRSLLERERRQMEISGHELSAPQLKVLMQRFYQSARLIAGTAQAEAMIVEYETLSGETHG